MKKCKGLIQDALLCKSSNAIRSSLKYRSIERAPGWVERADRMQPKTFCSPLDQAARPSEPLFWSSEVSDAPRMLFLTLQILGDVSLSFNYSFKLFNVT